MVEAMALKLLQRGPLEWHHLPTKYHEDLPSGSKIINGGQTEKQTDWRFEKTTFILQSTLKTCNSLTDNVLSSTSQLWNGAPYRTRLPHAGVSAKVSVCSSRFKPTHPRQTAPLGFVALERFDRQHYGSKERSEAPQPLLSIDPY
jgi:hypothetical protein